MVCGRVCMAGPRPGLSFGYWVFSSLVVASFLCCIRITKVTTTGVLALFFCIRSGLFWLRLTDEKPWIAHLGLGVSGALAFALAFALFLLFEA